MYEVGASGCEIVSQSRTRKARVVLSVGAISFAPTPIRKTDRFAKAWSKIWARISFWL